jgi:hypothetical protein
MVEYFSNEIRKKEESIINKNKDYQNIQLEFNLLSIKLNQYMNFQKNLSNIRIKDSYNNERIAE